MRQKYAVMRHPESEIEGRGREGNFKKKKEEKGPSNEV